MARLGPAALANVLALLPMLALAGGTITNCTQADLDAALAGGGTVVFACSGVLVLTNTEVITQDTTIDGNGYTVTISGGGGARLFQVNNNITFGLKNLRLADGHFAGANGMDGATPTPGQDGFGGGILNQGGNLILTSCTLSNNSALGGNAGQSTTGESGAAGGNGFGAGLCSLGGSMNLTN